MPGILPVLFTHAHALDRTRGFVRCVGRFGCRILYAGSATQRPVCAPSCYFADVVLCVRLTLLARVMRVPMDEIFAEFAENGYVQIFSNCYPLDRKSGSGAKQNNVCVCRLCVCVFPRFMSMGLQLHISLLANPSYLESVDPVVLGKTRARQERTGDADRSKIMGCVFKR